jgi:exocyst complex component 2
VRSFGIMLDTFHLIFCAVQSGGHEVWTAIIDLVKNVSEAMLSSLPNFWRIAKGFLDGKLKKVSNSWPFLHVYT